MTHKSGSSIGGLAGVALGLLLIGGMAGAPLYLAYFQADRRALDQAVQDEVEAVRRIVLNLDGHISVMSDVYDALGDEARPDKEAMRTLLEANRKLLDEARGIVQKFPSMSHGDSRATEHLGVNRIEAVLYLCAGKIHGNHAEFEEHLASGLRHEAEQRVDAVAALKRRAGLIEARKPDKALSDLNAQSRALEKGRAQLQAVLSRLTGEVAAKEKEVASLEEEAAEAHRNLAELASQGLSSADAQSAFLGLSGAARAAEARTASLRNGSLEHATLVFDESDDMLKAAYEGGEQEIGLLASKFGVALLEQQIAARGEAKVALERQQAALEQRLARLESERQNILEKADALTAGIDELLASAAPHADAADKARQQARTSFQRAAKYVGLAVTAAKKRTSDARTALRDLGDAVDDRLQQISKDGDTEAALHCLAAEIAYDEALTALQQMNAMQARRSAAMFVAEMIGREAPSGDPAEELEALRGEAAEQLARAIDALDKARSGIRNTRVKTLHGTTINGSNYLWQIDVIQAAVHLLEANLSDERSLRVEARERAYELLTQAAEGREQSPLLSPAIDTLQYLQRTAR